MNEHFAGFMERVRERVARADDAYSRWEAQSTRTVRRKRRGKSAAFLRTPEWAAARAECLRVMGPVCVECGSETQINVDHILPRSKFPELALEQSNLRPLCWPCNRRKAARVNA